MSGRDQINADRFDRLQQNKWDEEDDQRGIRTKRLNLPFDGSKQLEVENSLYEQSEGREKCPSELCGT
jgi:hypothetical protein